MSIQKIKARLAHIRKQIKAECVSYGELVELRNLKELIFNNPEAKFRISMKKIEEEIKESK
jgi:hypothetical protein